jgi:hypothetical protein
MAEPTPVVISRRATAIDTLLGKAGTASQPGDAPTAHAASHAAAGADEITPEAIGAAAADHDHSGDYIKALPAQVSSGEIAAGTEIALRSYSPADVVALIDEHSPAGEGGGDDGDAGWAPLLRMATDGDRRVLEVHDWTGGEGTKPTATGYISASGLTATIGDAVDVRGTAGANGQEIGLQKTSTHIQWRIGAGEWANLVALTDITGPAGEGGGGGTSLTQSAQTITTADVTGEVNTHYLCTIAGLTADRNLTLPTATAGDKIRVTILDGDDAFGLVLIGAATVTINGGSAATAWCTLSVAGQSIEFEATSTTNWQVVGAATQALISRQSASNTASLVFALPVGFREFRIAGDTYLPVTDGADAELIVSIDGGSNYAASGYLNASHYTLALGDSHMTSPVTNAMRLAYLGSGNEAGEGASFETVLMGAGSGLRFRSIAQGVIKNTSGVLVGVYGVAQYDGSTDRVTHIQIRASSGNIASGTFSLYGMY